MVLKKLLEKRRFPHVEQHDVMQCGIASIAIISQYYGRKVSLDSLEGYCHPGRNGVSLKGISDAAKSLGFETFGCKLPPESVMDNSKHRHSPKIEKLLNERPRKLQIVGIIMLCVVPFVVIAIL